MARPHAQLARLRQQIARADEDLLRRIGKRLALVSEIGAAKRAAGAPQPFRPQQAHARLSAMARAALRAGLKPAAVLSIWQELLGAALMRQARMQLCAPRSLLALARAQFGHSVPCVASTEKAALRKAARDAHTIAILPLLSSKPQRVWWADALPPPLQVIAALPFWAEKAAPPEALCIAHPAAEEEQFPRWQLVCAARAKLSKSACLAVAGRQALGALAPDAPLPAGARALGWVLPILRADEMEKGLANG